MIRDNGEIIATAPLMCSNYSFAFFGNLTKVEFIGSPQSDYNNFILTKKENKCINLFLNYLLDEYTDWDYLELRDVPECAAAVNPIRNLMSVESFSSHLEERVITVCPYMSLPNSAEIFLQGLKGDMRRSLRRRMRRLSEKYDVKMKTHSDFDSIKDAMHAFFALHQKRWNTKGASGVFAQDALRSFHVDIAESFAEKGWLNLNLLTADDKPAAAIYSFSYKQKNYEYLTGFDTEYNKYSVTNLLRLHVFKECIQKGLKEYDLMRDYEPYKRDWSTESRKNLEIRLIRKGLFAKIYGWAIKSNTVNALAQKFNKSLSVKQ